MMLISIPTYGEDRAGFIEAFNSIKAADAMRHIETLADDGFEGREAGSRGGRAASGYLVSELERLGAQPGGPSGAWYQVFQGNYRNLLALIPGSDKDLAQEYLLIGAHYDHVGYGTRTNSYGPWGHIHNGADDNASGTSVLLELIEATAKLPIAPRRTLLFALWDGEEKGLLGSKHWAAEPTVSLDQLRLAMNLDMVGRLRNGRVSLYGTRTSWGLRKAASLAARDAEVSIEFDWEVKSNSDHWTFYQRRIPFLMYHTGLHGDYHRPSDDVELINSEGVETIARAIFPLLIDLADTPSLPGFRAECLQETPATGRQLERTAPPLPPRLGVTWREPEGEEVGLKVTRVVSESPADIAGIRIGDRLIKIDGQAITSGALLRSCILEAEHEVELVVEREGEEPSTFSVQLAGSPVRIGMAWRSDPAEPETVFLTRVVPGSLAARCGLQVGDRIHQLDGHSFNGMTEFGRLVQDLVPGNTVVIEREGRIVDLEFPNREL
ncbi:MAG: M28 family peptidase, partial [Planctomycetales bacterium]|nr:M28 family peptidase [Planctomycetales bacterium]